MKKLMVASFLLCLLAGFLHAQPEGSADSQGILKLTDGFSLEVLNPAGVKVSVRPEEGQAELARGTYTVHYWAYDKTDTGGKQWQLRGYPSKTIRFTIGDQPAMLNITPEPISATVEVYGHGSDEYGFSLKLIGPADERYYLYCDGKRAEAPKLEITNADKSFDVTLSSSYG